MFDIYSAIPSWHIAETNSLSSASKAQILGKFLVMKVTILLSSFIHFCLLVEGPQNLEAMPGVAVCSGETSTFTTESHKPLQGDVGEIFLWFRSMSQKATTTICDWCQTTI